MAEQNKKPKKRLQFRHTDEDINVNALAKTIASEPRERETLKDIPVTPGNYRKFRGSSDQKLPKGIVWGIAGIIAIFIGGSIISYYVARNEVLHDVSSQVSILQQGVSDLQNLDPQSAAAQFQNLDTTQSFGGFAGALGFLFKGSSQAIQSFSDISQQLTMLASDAATLQTSTFEFFATGNGNDMVANLTSVKNDLAAIDADSNVLGSVMPSLESGTSTSLAQTYLPLKAQVEGAEQFLNSFIPWFATSTPHHVLIFFQNPSEEKPAGGFLGSYADVTLASATVTNFTVHDIADVDVTFKPNIVPPVPLQLETTRFRPADANWFFDFPTSASETIRMFEQAGLYAASGTTFDGAVAISPRVVSDLLSLTGPITLGSGTSATTFNSQNLLVQTQKIVQAGQETGATYPKGIIGSLGQAIFQDLTSTSTATTSTLATAPATSTRQQLLSMALNWMADKDVMTYFKDPALENFVETYGVGGDVYQLPQNFNGDYLAVVNADINADKSELYVNQSINFDAQIGDDGTMTDTLIINRKDTGNTSPYPWYQTTNQDYLQVFVPPASTLTNESGGIVRTVPAPINYAKNGYTTDPLIASIESSTLPLFTYPAVTTNMQFGKEVFAVWSRVRAGTSTQLTFEYTHRLFAIPAAGVQYQFVFEKQAGATGNYQFEVDAPLGYVFEENGLASYIYTSDDPPGRMVVTLTLEPLAND